MLFARKPAIYSRLNCASFIQRKQKMESYLVLTVNILYEKRKQVDAQYPLVCMHENFWKTNFRTAGNTPRAFATICDDSKLFQNNFIPVFVLHNLWFFRIASANISSVKESVLIDFILLQKNTYTAAKRIYTATKASCEYRCWLTNRH